MTENTLRKKLMAGEAAVGVGVRFCPSAEIAMVMKDCGYDWLFIDFEHSNFDMNTVVNMSQAALAAGITPMVRIPEGELSMGARALDGGAWGLVLPHINTAEQARELVRHFKYPPLGERSSGPPMSQLGFQSPAKGGDTFNEQMLLVAMIETPEAVENAESIAAVPGIDVLFIGTNDLTLTMGLKADLLNPRVTEAYEKVIAACRKQNKIPGAGGIYDDEVIKRNIRMGMRFILAGGDYLYMVSAARARSAAIADVVKATRTSS
jgi:2-keto-3-deoxy-L-rhamnonate aldolase RhmA